MQETWWDAVEMHRYLFVIFNTTFGGAGQKRVGTSAIVCCRHPPHHHGLEEWNAAEYAAALFFLCVCFVQLEKHLSATHVSSTLLCKPRCIINLKWQKMMLINYTSRRGEKTTRVEAERETCGSTVAAEPQEKGGGANGENNEGIILEN